MSPIDYSQVPTPARCYADFCLVPIGTGNVSVASEVAEVQKLLKASGLSCTMHSAGTTVEGSWDEVMKVIGQAHSVVHQTGVVRVQTAMRVGTRTDKAQTAEEKVKRVEELLRKDGQSS
ncbi:YkoF-like protein [Chaetomidium leptoderma]|uniref:YkoF-like protein n=1 Tax=Chaetomidium leptoderma TaxID=669021 RepID=A0AAN7A0N2_9PEZI|nr:YkoF-like protein [Chaetomidium leptoderma]